MDYVIQENQLRQSRNSSSNGLSGIENTLVPIDALSSAVLSPRQRCPATVAILAAGWLRSLAHSLTVVCGSLRFMEPFTDAGRQLFSLIRGVGMLLAVARGGRHA